MANITPGKYLAKVCDYGISMSKAGIPMATVRFRFDDDDGVKEWNWSGSFKEGKAQEFTIKALMVCGFAGDDLDALADGPSSGVLDMDKTVEIDVQMKPGADGVPRLTIAWVNEPGGSMKAKSSRAEARAALMGVNARAALAAAKAGSSGGTTTTAVQKPAAAGPMTDDELPF